MGYLFLLLSSSAIILLIHFLWMRKRFYKVAFQLPGPIGWPFIGVGFEMMNPEKYLSYMERTSRYYKSPFISWMGTKCFLYTNDPETVELVLNSNLCINKGDFYRFMAEAIGDGLFTSSSPRWNEHRRLINPAFSRAILFEFLPIFNEESNALLKKLANNQSKFIDMYEFLKRSILEAACQTTMGCKMNFQDDKSSIVFDSYNGMTEVCVKRMLSPWLYPDISFRNSSLFKKQTRVVNSLRGFIEGLLTGKENSKSETDPLKDPFYSRDINAEINDCVKKSRAIFLEQVRYHVKNGKISWDDVRDEANVIIAASFETTSTALYFVCLCLAIHPECQERLFNELIEIFPEKDANNTINVTREQLEQLSYTEMVINEAMRLFSPVPMVLRTVSGSDLELKKGIVLPIGTQIGIDIFNMQRSELYWGPHAKDFRPHLHFGPDSVERHKFAFIPFTKGLRMCLGSRYAIMIMKVFIAKLFRCYRVDTDSKLEDLQVKGTISLKLSKYPQFLCTPRE